MQRKEIQRGDLFYYDFGKREGSVQSGERPVMVIQADNFNANAPTIIVAAVIMSPSTLMNDLYLPSKTEKRSRFSCDRHKYIIARKC